MAYDIPITADLSIPAAEVQFRFSRSPGPGGQNVNCVNTQVELRFDVRCSSALDERQRQLLLRSLGGRVSQAGVFSIRSSRFRSQARNRADCLERFARRIAEGIRPPPPPRKRLRRSRAVQAKRLQQKKIKSLKKVSRRRPPL